MDIAVSISLGQFQLYGIVFLLGSFSVAALSDLRRMSAQVEFTEIWAVFIGIFFIIDIITWQSADQKMLLLKWLLILFFALVSNARFGLLFRVARGDLLACAAVLIILPFFLGLVFIILLKVMDLILKPLLRRAGSGSAYPFIPVVWAASILLFIAEWYFGSRGAVIFNIPI